MGSSAPVCRLSSPPRVRAIHRAAASSPYGVRRTTADSIDGVTRDAENEPAASNRPPSPPADEDPPVERVDSSRYLVPRGATDDTPRLRTHCAALLNSIGGPESFGKLTRAEQRRRVHVFTRFLTTLPSPEAAAPPGTAAAMAPQKADAGAESLAAGLRAVDVLSSLAEIMITQHGGYDRRLALSTLANLARLGLVDALCQQPKVRAAVIACVLAARSDEELAPFAIPCAYNMATHALFLRSLCAASSRVTPLLVRYLSDADAIAAASVTPAQAKLSRCAATMLRWMRESRASQRASINVLRDCVEGGLGPKRAGRQRSWRLSRLFGSSHDKIVRASSRDGVVVDVWVTSSGGEGTGGVVTTFSCGENAAGHIGSARCNGQSGLCIRAGGLRVGTY